MILWSKKKWIQNFQKKELCEMDEVSALEVIKNFVEYWAKVIESKTKPLAKVSLKKYLEFVVK